METGRWFEILKRENIDDYEGHLIAQLESDGVISFDLKYYNGGASFDEALSSALKDNNVL